MESGSTSVGSILSAIVFQIEEENKADPMMQEEVQSTHRSKMGPTSIESVMSLNTLEDAGEKEDILN
jgi:hypothetical protein